MTDEQRIEDLVNRFFDYDDHKIHFDGEITSTTVDLTHHDYYIGIGKLAEPFISASPTEFDTVYGQLTYDDQPVFISKDTTGAHIAYQAAPEYQDDIVPDDTMIDEANRAPLLTNHQVHNAIAGLAPMKAKQAMANNLTSVHVGGEPRMPGHQRPYTFTATYADLQKPIEDISRYRATTKAITKPHGEQTDIKPGLT